MRYFFVALWIVTASLIPAGVFGFRDTEHHFFRSSIDALAASGIVSGYDGEIFGPQNPLTRSELLKILMTSQDTELNLDTTPCFSDIKSDTWQQQYICSAKSLGYTRGYDDGTFRPNQSVTTLEALTLIARIESIALDGSGSEVERIRRVFDEQDILASYRYSDAQVITRGVAADVIFRTRELKKGSTPLDSLSVGCERGSGLTSGTKTLSIAGKERRYILALPSEYDPKKTYRVVIALHGRTSSNAQVQNYM